MRQPVTWRCLGLIFLSILGCRNDEMPFDPCETIGLTMEASSIESENEFELGWVTRDTRRRRVAVRVQRNFIDIRDEGFAIAFDKVGTLEQLDWVAYWHASGGDVGGHQFEILPESNVEVHLLDTVTQMVAGEFNLYFELVERRNFDYEFPEKVSFTNGRFCVMYEQVE